MKKLKKVAFLFMAFLIVSLVPEFAVNAAQYVNVNIKTSESIGTSDD